MNKMIILFLLIALSGTVHSQDVARISDSITAKGKKLYHSEMASWYGTDIFVEKFKETTNQSGGYFSYEVPPFTRCVFFSRDEIPKALVTISFDSTYQTTTAQVDDKQRDLTADETILFTLRKKTMAIIRQDSLFKTYNNTDFNVIPLIDNGSREVYVLTGPKATGVVIFGNDYLLSFDQDNNLVNKTRIHRNIIPVNYSQKKEKEVGAIHMHLPDTGEFMTATDICTLLLYEKFAKWEQHIVVSEKWLSIWSCTTDHLTIVPKNAIDKDKGK